MEYVPNLLMQIRMGGDYEEKVGKPFDGLGLICEHVWNGAISSSRGNNRGCFK